MNTNPRYHLDNDTMYIYHDNGVTDVLVRYLNHIWTLKASGVAKHEIEKGDEV